MYPVTSTDEYTCSLGWLVNSIKLINTSVPCIKYYKVNAVELKSFETEYFKKYNMFTIVAR